MNAPFLEQVKIQKGKSNYFDLSHTVKMTGKMGQLMPCLVMEVLPNEHIKLTNDTLVRFMPLISPAMHRLDVYTHYFFVPNRIIWEQWDDFLGGEAYALPNVTINTSTPVVSQAFLDYFGIPPISGQGSNAININALPLMAYQKIYNDYYRDQNLISELNCDLADGNQALGIMGTMRYRAWEKDYFTSALPSTQKGSAVSIPLGDVVFNAAVLGGANDPVFKNSLGNVPTGSTVLVNDAATGTIFSGAPAVQVGYDPDGTLSVSPTTINDLRQAFKTQEFLELMLRGGARINEILRNFFGIEGQDQRLERPEYITGTKSPLIISEVLNTTGTTGELPQGNMAGHAVSVGKGKIGSYHTKEHGYIIGIMSIIPRSSYSQGIPKTFLKSDYLDFFWPQFAHLGEQPVLNAEIYAYQSTDQNTFGYMPIHSDYRYIPSRIAGAFRNTLAHWTLNRTFSSLPTLNEELIDCDEQDDLDRIFAVQDGTDYILIEILHKIGATRPVPVFGTPSF